MALKDLDTKQPLGLCILMQQQSVTTSENSNPSLLPAHTALVAFSKTDHEPSVPASNLVSSTPPDASSHLGPSPLEIQPPSPLSYTSFETDATMIQHVMLGLGEDPDDPEVQDQMGKLVQQLGPAHVWDAFLEAQHTSLLKQDGTKRSPGGTFFTLLKKRRQTSKLRQAVYWSTPGHAVLLLAGVHAVQLNTCIAPSVGPFASPPMSDYPLVMPVLLSHFHL